MQPPRALGAVPLAAPTQHRPCRWLCPATEGSQRSYFGLRTDKIRSKDEPQGPGAQRPPCGGHRTGVSLATTQLAASPARSQAAGCPGRLWPWHSQPVGIYSPTAQGEAGSPSPGELGHGKSPAAGARHPQFLLQPSPAARGRHEGTFVLGRNTGVWGSCQGLVATQHHGWVLGPRQHPTGHGASWPHSSSPSAGPGKICAVPGNLLTSEKWVLEIKPHPKSWGKRAGGRAAAVPSAGGWRPRAAAVPLRSNALLITAWISSSIILPGIDAGLAAL